MTRMLVVDATPYGPEPSGAKRRCVELLRRLPAMLPKDVFEVHWARDGGGPPAGLEADNLVHATVGVSCRGGARRWIARKRDLARRRREAPFTHLLVDHGPVLDPRRCRTVVTVHDLRFLHGWGGPLRRFYGHARYGGLLRRAGAVVAVSPSVRDELVSAYGLERVVLARNAAAPAFSRRPPKEVAAAMAKWAVAGTYVLVVARAEPRKAVRAAVAAWSASLAAKGVSLVLVGEGHRARDGVVVLRDLPDADLAALYAGARWTLAPSLYEGYDLPVAEALACGSPVVASDTPEHRAFLAEGAQGLVLVKPPRRLGTRGSWPEAARALAEPHPPAVVAGSPATWDHAASAVASALGS
jgi:glycosyltransferase involved in cell wall biosynthesis